MRSLREQGQVDSLLPGVAKSLLLTCPCLILCVYIVEVSWIMASPLNLHLISISSLRTLPPNTVFETRASIREMEHMPVHKSKIYAWKQLICKV